MNSILVTISFYILAIICVVGAMGVVFSKKIVNSALMLFLAFACIAGLFILLNSDFVAMAQILIYSVGIAIIVIFAIMLTNPNSEQNNLLKRPRAIISLLSCFGLTVLIFISIFNNPFLYQIRENITVQKLIKEGSSGIIADVMFNVYVLPFEIISILLLIAIIGAVVLARRTAETHNEE